MTPQKRYYNRNKKKVFERHLKWYHKIKHDPEFKDKRKWYSIKSRYGLTKEQYYKLLNSQNRCCAICHKHEDELKKGLYIDHCHGTGQVRGLLCNTCNVFLGADEDLIWKLERAEEYVSRSIPTFR